VVRRELARLVQQVVRANVRTVPGDAAFDAKHVECLACDPERARSGERVGHFGARIGWSVDDEAGERNVAGARHANRPAA
jgi:hypothetical protein